MDIRETKRLKKAAVDDVTTTTIADLPDAVLVHILSFLSTEDAVKTVLIRAFGDLWRSVPVLDFTSGGNFRTLRWQHVNDGAVCMINNVLNLHNPNGATLDKLCIRLVFPIYDSIFTCDSRTKHCLAPYPQAMIDCIKKCVIYATSRKVKVLDLNFNVYCVMITHRPKLYDLSDHHVLVSEHLTHLRLTACSIFSCCKNVNLKSLKVLYLNEVTLTDVLMERLLVGCPVLEDLHLVDCLYLKKLTCRSPKLTKLTIARSKFEYCITHVSCPYVLRLELLGAVRNVVLLDVSSVADVAIHVTGDIYNYSIGNIGLNRAFWGLVQKTSHCKIFRAGGWAVEELAMCAHISGDWPTFCYKSLVIEMALRIENQPGIALLLRNSQSLETLTLHFHPKEYDKYLGGPVYKGEWDSFEQGAVYWNKISFPRLATIDIYGEINCRYVLQLVQVLLRCAIGLKKLVISTKDKYCPFGKQGYDYTFDLLQQLSEAYKALPRASPEAVVNFS